MSVSPPPAMPKPGDSPRSDAGSDSADRGKPSTKQTSPADELIAARIAEAATALWWAELIRHCLRLILGGIACVGIWVFVDHWIHAGSVLLRVVTLIGLVTIAAIYILRNLVPLIGNSVCPEYAARSLEKNHPELRQSLTSYVTLRDAGSGKQDGLQERVVRSIGASTASYLKKHDELPAEATGNLKLWMLTSAAIAALALYAVVSPKDSVQSVQRLVLPIADIDPAMRVSIKNVTPGNTEAIAGRTLTIAADIRGMRQDERAVVEIDDPTGTRHIELEPLSSPRLTAEVTLDPSVSGTVPYRIVAGDSTSATYHLQVKDVPVIAITAIHYAPPAYTGIAPFTRNTAAISAVDGTQITLHAKANRPINRAAIEFNPKLIGNTVQATDGAIEMKVGKEGKTLTVTFPLRIDLGRSQTVRRDHYRVRVWDDGGITNPDPIIYPIEIIRDLPPEIAIMLPTRVPKEIPLGTQQIIEVHASDADFGLQEIRLQMKNGIKTIGEPVLWQHETSQHETGKVGNQVAEYRFRPSELGLIAGDTVRVIAIATDNRVSAIPRTFGDSQTLRETLRGVTQTDAIELRIIASETSPPDEEAASEGLSEPDDQPAADPKKQESQSGGGKEGGQQQGGGGGKEGDQGNQQAGESGQQGSGGGKGDQSQKKEGQEQGEGSQQGSGENQQGESGESNQGEGGKPSEASRESSGQETGENDPGGGDPSEGQMGNDDAPPQGDPGQGASGESPSQNSGSSDSQSPSSPNQSSSDRGGDDQGSDPESSDDKSSGDGSPESSDASDSPPGHDGEAFERIQEYLNEKQPSSSGNQQSQEASSDPSSSEQQSSEQPRPEQPSQDPSGKDPSDSSMPSEPSENSPPNDPSSGDQVEESSGDSLGDSPSDSSEGSQPSREGQPSDESPQGPESSESGDQGDKPSDEPTRSEGQPGKQDSQGQPSGDGQASDEGQEKGPEMNEGESGEGQPQPGEPASPSKDGTPSPAESSAEKGMPTDDNSSTDSRSPQPSSQGRPGSSDGSGESQPSDESNPLPPPDQANADYAKKATDMVLDYLDQTRDAPDQELLDRLQWTEQDLKDFQQRWQNVRELDPAKGSDSQNSRTVEDALRSLGLRPPTTGENTTTTEKSDALRSIRDAGNRRRPPPAYRDAFDAFRRKTGQRQSP